MTAFQRLESQTNELKEGVSKLNEFLAQVDEVLNAVVEITGKELVLDKLNELRKRANLEKLLAVADKFKQDIDKGVYEQVTNVSLGDVVVGKYLYDNGEEIVPEGVPLDILFDKEDESRKNMFEPFVGKAAGDTVKMGNGENFTITAIYRLKDVNLD